MPPLLTAQYNEPFGGIKRVRNDDSLDASGSDVYMEESLAPEHESGVSMVKDNMEQLKNLFPCVSDGIIISILESTGNKLDQAQLILSQILGTGKFTDKASRIKRLRNCDEDECTTQQQPAVHIPVQNSPTEGGNQFLATWLNSVMKKLQGVQCVEDAYHRLKVLAEDLLARSPALKQSVKLQKIMSRAILGQADKINGLITKVDELEGANRRLKDANAMLSYYITSICNNKGEYHSFSNHDVF